jgi:hypothetical protein
MVYFAFLPLRKNSEMKARKKLSSCRKRDNSDPKNSLCCPCKSDFCDDSDNEFVCKELTERKLNIISIPHFPILRITKHQTIGCEELKNLAAMRRAKSPNVALVLIIA